MFLDDDVVLAPDCVAPPRRRPAGPARLRRPGGRLPGRDGRRAGGWDRPARRHGGDPLPPRSAGALIRFRWEPGKCECQCCCDDLRRLGRGIGYLPERGPGTPLAGRGQGHVGCRPAGRSGGPGCCHGRPGRVLAVDAPGRILAAFNRRHRERFRRQFLGTLRGAGNEETVTAIGYGLYPSERRILAGAAGGGVSGLPGDAVAPPIRRLRDFQSIVASLAGRRRRSPTGTPAT